MKEKLSLSNYITNTEKVENKKIKGLSKTLLIDDTFDAKGQKRQTYFLKQVHIKMIKDIAYHADTPKSELMQKIIEMYTKEHYEEIYNVAIKKYPL